MTAQIDLHRVGALRGGADHISVSAEWSDKCPTNEQFAVDFLR